MVRIQLWRDGKIVDGIMMPEPIDGSYIELDVKSMFKFIEVFRQISIQYISESKKIKI